jgi:hypothetical protein
MNLERKSLSAVKRGAQLLFQLCRTRSGESFFGQNARLQLDSHKRFMLWLLFARRAAVCLCCGLFLGIPAAVFGQTNYYRTNGTEYAVVSSLPGDQVFPDVAITPDGGFVVWQDNITDSDGWGVSAQRLDSTLSASLSPFRVNAQVTNDQKNARVTILKNGGAAFVWQGGRMGGEQVYARFLGANNTWLTDDVQVNPQSATNVTYNSYTQTNVTLTIVTNTSHGKTTYTTNKTTKVTTTTTTNTSINVLHAQISPAVATLTNGNVVVIWASFNQARSNSLQDVYGQVLSPSGQKVGAAFLVNQFTNFNQRRPTVAALKNGGFIVAWVSEQQRVRVSSIDNAFYNAGGAAYVSTNENNIGSSYDTNYFASASELPAPSVDIYARFFKSNGVASSAEFLVNSNSNPCACPAVAVATDGAFMVTWCERDVANPVNRWDIYARPFSSAGVGGAISVVNTTLVGDQKIPQIRAIDLDYMIVWTTFDQDGSLEGVYGRFVHEDGTPVNGEFRVNTTTLSRQLQPAVASDGAERFLVVWSAYNVASYNMDLFAQRYINVLAVLEAMDAPFVHAPFVVSNGVYQPQLQVAWPMLSGISVSNYEVYVDGAATPMAVIPANSWTMTAANGLTTNSTHSFQVGYVVTDGRHSPRSPAAEGTTWGGQSWGGIPFEWMAAYYGTLTVSFVGSTPTYNWPSPNSLVAPGGPTVLQVFLSGGNPLVPDSWLQTKLTKTTQGMFLSWNTQPGYTYQVQVTTNFNSWSNLGQPRFAADTSDSIYVGGGVAGYYRVVLLR